MKIKINWVEVSNSLKGGEYKKVTLEDGQTISCWPNSFSAYKDVIPGAEVEGEIRLNKKFKNLVDVRADGGVVIKVSPQAKTSDIGAAMETKTRNIREAQENREQGIRIASTASGATAITVALIGKVSKVEKEEVEQVWKSWRSFLWKHWDDVVDLDEPPEGV